MLRAIITAAGYSARFRGVYKDMLPIVYNGKVTTALDVNIQQAFNIFGADEVVIVSRSEKAAEHLKIAAQYNHTFVVPNRFEGQYDLLGSIVSGATVGGTNHDCLLMLADTVKYFKHNMPSIRFYPTFGLFVTDTPEKYSVIINGKIVTKPQDGTHKWHNAWGMVHWPGEFTMEMFHLMFEGLTYDEIFNRMIDKYGMLSFKMEKYYDLGSFKAYAEYMVEYNEQL